MKKRTSPTLASLAAWPNPLEDIDIVVARLKAENKESRYLEWKLTPPLGPTVTQRNKYRAVKAAISFANADGGFVIFGVGPNGNWIGLNPQELAIVDPAHILELINGCVFPDIQSVNFSEFKVGNRVFALLHIPPSGIAPHVTTKDILEKDEFGKTKQVLSRHAVYYRQGAKSDLATPLQHTRIVGKRIDGIRDDLVRRVREVTVPVVGGLSNQGRFSATSITVARLSKDPNVPAVRLTRSKDGTSGIFLHEELSEGLLEEINNVVDVNILLNKGRTEQRFMLGDPVYYRIYSERHHVEESVERINSLLRTGFEDLYAPFLYWVLKLPATHVVSAMKSVAQEQKNPQILNLIRLVTLLGPLSSDWLWSILDKQFAKHPQPPDYYWAFKEIRSKGGEDRRLRALRVTGKATILLPGAVEIPIEKLFGAPSELASHLSKTCFAVFAGNKELRTTARKLDILTYGAEVEMQSEAIGKLLS